MSFVGPANSCFLGSAYVAPPNPTGPASCRSTYPTSSIHPLRLLPPTRVSGGPSHPPRAMTFPLSSNNGYYIDAPHDACALHPPAPLPTYSSQDAMDNMPLVSSPVSGSQDCLLPAETADIPPLASAAYSILSGHTSAYPSFSAPAVSEAPQTQDTDMTAPALAEDVTSVCVVSQRGVL